MIMFFSEKYVHVRYVIFKYIKLQLNLIKIRIKQANFIPFYITHNESKKVVITSSTIKVKQFLIICIHGFFLLQSDNYKKRIEVKGF